MSTHVNPVIVEKMKNVITRYIKEVEKIEEAEPMNAVATPIHFCLKTAYEWALREDGTIDSFLKHFRNCLIEVSSTITRVALETTKEEIKKELESSGEVSEVKTEKISNIVLPGLKNSIDVDYVNQVLHDLRI